jgi:hypothetical protein
MPGDSVFAIGMTRFMILTPACILLVCVESGVQLKNKCDWSYNFYFLGSREAEIAMESVGGFD